MRTSTKAVCAGLLLAALVGTTATPRAQAQGPTVEVFDATRHRIQTGFTFYTGSVTNDILGVRTTSTRSFLTPSLAYRFRILMPEGQGQEGFFLDADLAWRGAASIFNVTTEIAGSSSSDESSYFRMANPMLGARAGWRGDHWYARGGIGLTLPLTNAYDEGTGLEAFAVYASYLGSGATFGLWDPWLSLPLNMALVLRGDGAFRDRWFYAGAALDMAFAFSTPREGDPGSDLFFFQLAAYGAFRPIEELGLGARLQLVVSSEMNRCNETPGDECNDEAYVAMVAPFVRLEIQRFFAEARLLMNLDDPLGFAFDEGKIWGITLLGGGRL